MKTFEVLLAEIKHILVTRLRFMGDIILTTPVLSALKQAYPASRITYLAEAPYPTLLEHHPAVDEILQLEKQNQKSVYLSILRKKFDLAIDLFGNPRSALLVWLSGAGIRIGGDFRGRKYFYTHKIRDDGKPKTAIEFHLRYLSPLGIDLRTSAPQIVVTDEELEWARHHLAERGYDLAGKIVGVHPGATWPAKRWFPERFAALADELAHSGHQVLFTMGPGEETLLDDVLSRCRTRFVRPRQLSLRQLAAVLRAIDVYVSNDCGPMHLAPAVGTPTVGIFGPGEPEIWFPYRREKGHRLVYREIDCSRCHLDLCDKMECMRAIQVGDVLQAVEEAIAFKDRI